jgi:hypothetical protein
MENTPSPKKDLALHRVYKFLGGSALGLVMLLVPYWLHPIEPNFFSLGIAGVWIVACGSLSVKFGQQFLEALSNLLSSSGLY